MQRRLGARVLLTSAAAVVRRTRLGPHESAPQSPQRIWQRNGGKGMKIKSIPVPIPLPPFLCPQLRCPTLVRRAPSAPRRSLPTPPSRAGYVGPMLRRFGARVLLKSSPPKPARPRDAKPLGTNRACRCRPFSAADRSAPTAVRRHTPSPWANSTAAPTRSPAPSSRSR